MNCKWNTGFIIDLDKKLDRIEAKLNKLLPQPEVNWVDADDVEDQPTQGGD